MTNLRYRSGFICRDLQGPACRYFADILVEDVVVELKGVERLANQHTAQCLKRASGRTLCLLVNFQKPKAESKRIVCGFQISEPMEGPPMAR